MYLRVEEGGEVHDVARVEIGTQFTCFTGTKVQKVALLVQKYKRWGGA